ncbi:MAG TPA: alpha-ribazole phosphatase [Candidatus Avacidaminococcus intestinavium]|uniref:Alpha-ribazole phosphatase n=1 Tax=Candidatus Avacidaminococcus intestinavium TaxID=2840684 RepID=A0A9D1SLI7_9FIRM|nr:alpha-ribazole phosphatase [Candidatus Avacidaminococcus intestinavium]
MKNFYLVRHGQTNGNKSFAFQGHTNNPLNETGKKQAEKLASYLAKTKFEAIYTSDLIRTVETATPIAKQQDLPIIEIPALKEISFGEWEGQSYDEINHKWPQEVQDFFAKPGEVQICGGESFAEVQTRAWKAMEDIMEESNKEQNILIVSHGGTLRTIICKILNIHLNDIWKLGIDNVGVSRMLKKDDSCWINCINETAFLKD